jgi:DNA-directed RNA polymerase subunit M/transcription elongation factor TFIIS
MSRISGPGCSHGRVGYCFECERMLRDLEERFQKTEGDCPNCGRGKGVFTGSTPQSFGGDGKTGYQCDRCGYRWRV